MTSVRRYAYLVMQYLDGETLAQRLTGPLPLPTLLRWRQIATRSTPRIRGHLPPRSEAGEHLSDQVGRQAAGLRPREARHSLRRVRLFADVRAASRRSRSSDAFPAPSPTCRRSSSKAWTPTRRADIFALGALLYESVTGKKVFEGRSQASLISAIMSSTPVPIAASVPMAPPALDHLVAVCLAKDRDDRWQSAGDVMRELRWIAGLTTSGVAAAPALTPRRHRRERWAWGLAAVMTLAAGGMAMRVVRAPPTNTPLAARFSIPPPDNGFFGRGASGPMIAVSPDGRTLAFVAALTGQPNMIWLRPLDALAARALPGTERAAGPFWSPDSQSVGFFADGKLKAGAVDGKEVRTVCEAPDGRQAAWGPAGAILFVGSLRGVGGLRRVSESGGAVTTETTPDQQAGETGHLLPAFLPDGQHYLYSVTTAGGAGVMLGSLGSKTRRLIVNPSELSVASSVAYAPPGHLLFVRDTTLVALPLDLARFERSGEARPVAEGVQSIGQGGEFASFSVSANGVLAYWRGAIPATSRLSWFTRDGQETRTTLPERDYGRISLAPDGTRAAADAQGIGTGTSAILMLDLVRGTATRFTNDPFSILPIWSPDGASVIFSSTRALGRLAPYRQGVTAGADARRLFDPTTTTVITDWSADGRTVVYETNRPRGEIGTFALDGSAPPRPFLHTAEGQSEGRLSPDGRWMAYVSHETGGEGVYVTAFPSGDGKWPISEHGGNQPQWRADGKELYYRTWNGKVKAVTITTEPAFRASVPMGVVDESGEQYAATGDGRRFLLVLRVTERISPPITVVTNWTAALRK